MVKLNGIGRARAAALTASIAIVTAAFPVASFAQQSPSQTLEQARSGEDGTSGAGAGSGNTSTGNANRDGNGNGGSVSADDAASAGSAGTTENAEPEAPAGPANAELLAALGILDDVTAYELDVLANLDIPIALLPPPPVEPAPAAPPDIDTGGVGGSGASETISTEPGDGAAPAGGSTNTVSEDGAGSAADGEKVRDRPRKNAEGGTDTATPAAP